MDLYGGDSNNNNSTTIPDDDNVDAEGDFFPPLCFVVLPVFYALEVPLSPLFDALDSVGLNFLYFLLVVPLLPLLFVGALCDQTN